MRNRALILVAAISLWTAMSFSGIVLADASRPRVSPTATPTVSRPRISVTTPTPLGTPSQGKVAPAETPVPTSTPTLLDLQSGIRQKLLNPAVNRSRVGVKIVSLATGKVVYEQDAEKYFTPASNMKNFTVATAFERLGPNFRFVTSVYATAPVDPSGTIKGDLRILGRGDVSMSTSFATKPTSDPEIYYERMDRLADAIVASGVKLVEGSLVADESYFTGHAVPVTWEWDDIGWYDGAEVSAFPLNNNAMDLKVRGTSNGQPCAVTISPPTPLYVINNQCTTGGSQRAIVVDKALEKNTLTVSGTIPAGTEWTGSPTFTHPADLFVAMLKERLEKKGVIVTGTTRTLAAGVKPTEQIEITRLESPPFSEVAAKTMKPSQNMYTETILWTLGEQIGRKSGGTGISATLGVNVVKSFMQQAGIPLDSVVQYDGSGMSRHDVVTPGAIVQLYTYMAKQSPNALAWRASLAVGGIDGTLRNRFKGTAASENFRGKTGTLDQVSALSGYVTTRSGEQLVLSIIVNNMPSTGSGPRTAIIDSIVLDLANYTGRID
ncbi:MAG TPA: D-alanyl-D-alanine carboxypeptidase/D-alanyl-D-alanine-endopeptidase [Pyrinomonadaceae bacterium]|nr:D-alanyl-D-alanine carboxypeptidase/D-alanyl-D-alanine-endopeptidase [Pyrinomonadaceae bacterium]